MQRRQYLIGVGVGATAVLAGCTGSDDEEDPEENGGEESEDEDEETNGEEEGDEEVDAEEALEDEDTESTVEGLEILEHELVEDEFSVSIEGVVANNTGDELGYVEVGAVLYNADGQRIGDSFTNTTDLPDGEEWAFEILTTEDAEDVDDYTIAVTDSPF
ncbi:MAG: hypothetical protein IH933_04385 [Euryarchaeota archaeon]|jgi:cobalamin biosynthesis protein CobT|nr:hypothetical protein [Euryarchaeota archaeon]